MPDAFDNLANSLARAIYGVDALGSSMQRAYVAHKQTPAAIAGMISKYGNLTDTLQTMLTQFERTGTVSADVQRSYLNHIKSLSQMSSEYRKLEAQMKLMADRALPLSTKISKISDSITNVRRDTVDWIIALTGLQLSQTGLTDTLLKFNRTVFESTRAGSLYGESVGSFETALIKAKQTTTISKQGFAEMNLMFKEMQLGIPMAAEEVAGFAEILQSRLGYSEEVAIKKTQELLTLQNKMPMILDRITQVQLEYAKGFDKGEAAAGRLYGTLKGFGASTKDIQTVMQMVRPPTAASTGYMDFEKKISDANKRIKNSQLSIAEASAEVLINIAKASAIAAEQVSKLAGAWGGMLPTIVAIAGVMRVMNLSGIIKGLGKASEGAKVRMGLGGGGIPAAVGAGAGITEFMQRRAAGQGWGESAGAGAISGVGVWGAGKLGAISMAKLGSKFGPKGAVIGGTVGFLGGAAAGWVGSEKLNNSLFGKKNAPDQKPREDQTQSANEKQAVAEVHADMTRSIGVQLNAVEGDIYSKAVQAADDSSKDSKTPGTSKGEDALKRQQAIRGNLLDHIQNELNINKKNSLLTILINSGMATKKDIARAIGVESESDLAVTSAINKAIKESVALERGLLDVTMSVGAAMQRQVETIKLYEQSLGNIRQGADVFKELAKDGVLASGLEIPLRMDVEAARAQAAMAAKAAMAEVISIQAQTPEAFRVELGLKFDPATTAAIDDTTRELETHKKNKLEREMDLGSLETERNDPGTSKDRKEVIAGEIAAIRIEIEDYGKSSTEASKRLAELTQSAASFASKGLIKGDTIAALQHVNALIDDQMKKFQNAKSNELISEEELAKIETAMGNLSRLSVSVGHAMKQAVASILAPLLEIESRGDTVIMQAKETVAYKRQEMQLTEAGALGMSKSYTAYKDTIVAIGEQISLLKQREALFQKESQAQMDQFNITVDWNAAMSEGPKYAEKVREQVFATTGNQEQAVAAEMTMLTHLNKHREVRMATRDLIKEGMELTKSFREGYLDAMTEMVANAGDFAAVIGTQEKGVTQLIAMGARSTFKYGGVASKQGLPEQYVRRAAPRYTTEQGMLSPDIMQTTPLWQFSNVALGEPGDLDDIDRATMERARQMGSSSDIPYGLAYAAPQNNTAAWSYTDQAAERIAYQNGRVGGPMRYPYGDGKSVTDDDIRRVPRQEAFYPGTNLVIPSNANLPSASSRDIRDSRHVGWQTDVMGGPLQGRGLDAFVNSAGKIAPSFDSFGNAVSRFEQATNRLSNSISQGGNSGRSPSPFSSNKPWGVSDSTTLQFPTHESNFRSLELQTPRSAVSPPQRFFKDGGSVPPVAAFTQGGVVKPGDIVLPRKIAQSSEIKDSIAQIHGVKKVSGDTTRDGTSYQVAGGAGRAVFAAMGGELILPRGSIGLNGGGWVSEAASVATVNKNARQESGASQSQSLPTYNFEKPDNPITYPQHYVDMYYARMTDTYTRMGNGHEKINWLNQIAGSADPARRDVSIHEIKELRRNKPSEISEKEAQEQAANVYLTWQAAQAFLPIAKRELHKWNRYAVHGMTPSERENEVSQNNRMQALHEVERVLLSNSDPQSKIEFLRERSQQAKSRIENQRILIEETQEGINNGSITKAVGMRTIAAANTLIRDIVPSFERSDKSAQILEEYIAGDTYEGFKKATENKDTDQLRALESSIISEIKSSPTRVKAPDAPNAYVQKRQNLAYVREQLVKRESSEKADTAARVDRFNRYYGVKLPDGYTPDDIHNAVNLIGDESIDVSGYAGENNDQLQKHLEEIQVEKKGYSDIEVPVPEHIAKKEEAIQKELSLRKLSDYRQQERERIQQQIKEISVIQRRNEEKGIKVPELSERRTTLLQNLDEINRADETAIKVRQVVEEIQTSQVKKPNAPSAEMGRADLQNSGYLQNSESPQSQNKTRQENAARSGQRPREVMRGVDAWTGQTKIYGKDGGRQQSTVGRNVHSGGVSSSNGTGIKTIQGRPQVKLENWRFDKGGEVGSGRLESYGLDEGLKRPDELGMIPNRPNELGMNPRDVVGVRDGGAIGLAGGGTSLRGISSPVFGTGQAANEQSSPSFKFGILREAKSRARQSKFGMGEEAIMENLRDRSATAKQIALQRPIFSQQKDVLAQAFQRSAEEEMLQKKYEDGYEGQSKTGGKHTFYARYAKRDVSEKSGIYESKNGVEKLVESVSRDKREIPGSGFIVGFDKDGNKFVKLGGVQVEAKDYAEAYKSESQKAAKEQQEVDSRTLTIRAFKSNIIGKNYTGVPGNVKVSPIIKGQDQTVTFNGIEMPLYDYQRSYSKELENRENGADFIQLGNRSIAQSVFDRREPNLKPQPKNKDASTILPDTKSMSPHEYEIVRRKKIRDLERKNGELTKSPKRMRDGGAIGLAGGGTSLRGISSPVFGTGQVANEQSSPSFKFGILREAKSRARQSKFGMGEEAIMENLRDRSATAKQIALQRPIFSQQKDVLAQAFQRSVEEETLQKKYEDGYEGQSKTGGKHTFYARYAKRDESKESGIYESKNGVEKLVESESQDERDIPGSGFIIGFNKNGNRYVKLGGVQIDAKDYATTYRSEAEKAVNEKPVVDQRTLTLRAFRNNIVNNKFTGVPRARGVTVSKGSDGKVLSVNHMGTEIPIKDYLLAYQVGLGNRVKHDEYMRNLRANPNLHPDTIASDFSAMNGLDIDWEAAMRNPNLAEKQITTAVANKMENAGGTAEITDATITRFRTALGAYTNGKMMENVGHSMKSPMVEEIFGSQDLSFKDSAKDTPITVTKDTQIVKSVESGTLETDEQKAGNLENLNTHRITDNRRRIKDIREAIPEGDARAQRMMANALKHYRDHSDNSGIVPIDPKVTNSSMAAVYDINARGGGRWKVVDTTTREGQEQIALLRSGVARTNAFLTATAKTNNVGKPPAEQYEPTLYPELTIMPIAEGSDVKGLNNAFQEAQRRETGRSESLKRQLRRSEIDSKIEMEHAQAMSKPRHLGFIPSSREQWKDLRRRSAEGVGYLGTRVAIGGAKTIAAIPSMAFGAYASAGELTGFGDHPSVEISRRTAEIINQKTSRGVDWAAYQLSRPLSKIMGVEAPRSITQSIEDYHEQIRKDDPDSAEWIIGAGNTAETLTRLYLGYKLVPGKKKVKPTPGTQPSWWKRLSGQKPTANPDITHPVAREMIAGLPGTTQSSGAAISAGRLNFRPGIPPRVQYPRTVARPSNTSATNPPIPSTRVTQESLRAVHHSRPTIISPTPKPRLARRVPATSPVSASPNTARLRSAARFARKVPSAVRTAGAAVKEFPSIVMNSAKNNPWATSTAASIALSAGFTTAKYIVGKQSRNRQLDRAASRVLSGELNLGTLWGDLTDLEKSKFHDRMRAVREPTKQRGRELDSTARRILDGTLDIDNLRRSKDMTSYELDNFPNRVRSVALDKIKDIPSDAPDARVRASNIYTRIPEGMRDDPVFQETAHRLIFRKRAVGLPDIRSNVYKLKDGGEIPVNMFNGGMPQAAKAIYSGVQSTAKRILKAGDFVVKRSQALANRGLLNRLGAELVPGNSTASIRDSVPYEIAGGKPGGPSQAILMKDERIVRGAKKDDNGYRMVAARRAKWGNNDFRIGAAKMINEGNGHLINLMLENSKPQLAATGGTIAESGSLSTIAAQHDIRAGNVTSGQQGQSSSSQHQIVKVIMDMSPQAKEYFAPAVGNTKYNNGTLAV